MEWLNYHHLLYFWTVARTGSVARASEELRLSPPAISNQIHKLEDALGEKLLKRSGRRLILTEMGRIAMRYADEIFSLGLEFTDRMKNLPIGRPIRFGVGVADVLPKPIAFRLLEPAFKMKVPIRIVCREDSPDQLMADLAVHNLDVVLADSPIGVGSSMPAYSRLLAEGGVSFFASKRHRNLQADFPKSMHGVPFLLPTADTAFRHNLDEWFHLKGIRPTIIGEYADFALLTEFAQGGYGIFAGSSLIESQMRKYGFQRIGRVNSLHTRYYAISIERKIQHPAVSAICNVPLTTRQRSGKR
jgi:LysR family transcriptional regulator, transcriptional activator of nhaA